MMPFVSALRGILKVRQGTVPPSVHRTLSVLLAHMQVRALSWQNALCSSMNTGWHAVFLGLLRIAS